MIKVQGKYNQVIIYSDKYDETAYKQLLEICNYERFKGANIKVMPDYHAGKGCVIGFTSVQTPAIIPNLIGVDIGCGILAVKLTKKIDVRELDDFIRDSIPSGTDVNSEVQPFYALTTPINKLHCFQHLENIERLEKSLGSLGGGELIATVQVNSL